MNQGVEDHGITTIEKIELENTDDGGREDLKRAAALSTNNEFGVKYFLNIRLLGSLLALSCGCISAFWGFSPPAAVLTFIAEDIGMLLSSEKL
jgi:hypothetical protein